MSRIYFLSMCRKDIFDIYVTEYGTALTTILPILFLYLNTVIVCRRSWYIATHVWKIYDFKIEVVPLIIILVLSWPLSSNSRYKSKYDADEAVSLVSLASSSGGYFQQVVSIPIGTNCAPLLADLFLYSYESEFLQKLVKDKKIHEARAFNLTYSCISDMW
jgi:TctA family transporter